MSGPGAADGPGPSPDAPWWTTGGAPEPVLTGRCRRRRVPLLVACAVGGAVLLWFFVWIGMAAQHA